MGVGRQLGDENVKRIITGLLAVTVLPSLALAADQTINLTANAPKFCKFDANPTFNNFDNFTVVSSSTSSSVLNVTTPTNPLGVMNEAGFTFAVQATCNFPSTVVMTTLNGGLKDPSPEPIGSGTFLRRIDYHATATWDSAGVSNLYTDGSANKSSTPRSAATPHTGLLAASITFNPNTSAPLAAGDYTDTLRISLTPQ